MLSFKKKVGKVYHVLVFTWYKTSCLYTDTGLDIN